jgi:uncharacterized protein YigE (DUF2233 family)
MPALALLLLALIAQPAPEPPPADDGICYARQQTASGVDLHWFSIDPARHALRLLRPARGKAATVADMARAAGEPAPRLAVNGSFFLKDHTPLGLLISDGQLIQGVRKVDWGVFFVRDGRPGLIHRRDWPGEAGVSFAIQSGPRLVVDGRPVKVRPQRARRTVIGVQADGQIFVAATASPVDLSELVTTLIDQGVTQALNLDGGSSSQLYAPAWGLDLAGAPVVNAVGVF